MKLLHRLAHTGHFLAHCIYLLAVSIQAHGAYGIAAGVLLIFVVGLHLIGGDDHG